MASEAGVGQAENTQFLGRLGYGVGIPAFLDSEASKVAAYYRGIEEGSNEFLGRVITGLFGDESGPRGGLIQGDLTPFGEGSGQKLVPFVKPQSLEEIGAVRGLAYLRRTDKLTGRGGAGTRGVIKRPIVAQQAYKKALKSFKAREKEEAAVRQVLGNTGVFSGLSGKPTTFVEQRFQRQAALTSRQVQRKGGFLAGKATSGFTQSLVNLDRTFQRELTDINRLLAQGLAAEVATIQQEEIKRKGVSSGRLIAATNNPQNRFPR